MQTCMWSSWCHCHSLSLASVKSRLVLPFWYWLSRVVPKKGPLNGCVCVCAWQLARFQLTRRITRFPRRLLSFLSLLWMELFQWRIQELTEGVSEWGLVAKPPSYGSLGAKLPGTGVWGLCPQWGCSRQSPRWEVWGQKKVKPKNTVDASQKAFWLCSMSSAS